MARGRRNKKKYVIHPPNPDENRPINSSTHNLLQSDKDHIVNSAVQALSRSPNSRILKKQSDTAFPYSAPNRYRVGIKNNEVDNSPRKVLGDANNFGNRDHSTNTNNCLQTGLTYRHRDHPQDKQEDPVLKNVLGERSDAATNRDDGEGFYRLDAGMSFSRKDPINIANQTMQIHQPETSSNPGANGVTTKAAKSTGSSETCPAGKRTGTAGFAAAPRPVPANALLRSWLGTTMTTIVPAGSMIGRDSSAGRIGGITRAGG